MQYTTYTHNDAESYLAEALEHFTEWYRDDPGAILSAVVDDAWWVVDHRDELGLYDAVRSSLPIRWLDAAYSSMGIAYATTKETYEKVFVEALYHGAREMLGLA